MTFLCVCICVCVCVYSFRHLACCCILTVVNNVGIHLEQISLHDTDFTWFEYTPSHGFAELYGSTISKFFMNFHNGCASLHSHQQCAKVVSSSHICQHLSLVLFVVVILAIVRCCFIVVLIRM